MEIFGTAIGVIISTTVNCFIWYKVGRVSLKTQMLKHLVRNIEAHRYSPELQKGMKVLLEAYDEY